MKVVRNDDGVVVYSGETVKIERLIAHLNQTSEGRYKVDDFTVSYSSDEIKGHVRRSIADHAGDTESLLGTTADGAQLALFMLAELIKSISDANDLDDLKSKLEPRLQLAEKHLKAIEEGSVIPTFAVKGVDSVVGDIEQRATAVSLVLSQA